MHCTKKKLVCFGLGLSLIFSVLMTLHSISTPYLTEETYMYIHDKIHSVSGNLLQYPAKIQEKPINVSDAREHGRYKLPHLHLSLVVCGTRAPEALITLKSAAIFTKQPMTFHIFCEFHLQDFFKQKISQWPSKFKESVQLLLYNLSFPESNIKQSWQNLFKPCASQRLFLPNLLPRVDALLYVDTDILFMRSLTDIWQFFEKFNSTQAVALAPEAEDSSTGWYNRFAKHPYFGALGLNSGVMLMNLTRLRTSSWDTDIKKFFLEYNMKITWGDQDLINIYLHFHPEEVFVFSCSWNYRIDHCIYMSVCKDIQENGIAILHGSRRIFHKSEKELHSQPAFKAVYDAFLKYELSSDVKENLVGVLEQELLTLQNKKCAKVLRPYIYFLTN